MNKYKNKKCEYGGITFDSMEEMAFYKVLLAQVERGELLDIKVHPKYELIPKFEYRGVKRRATEYEADFWVRTKANTEIIYDIKGLATSTALLKSKLFEYHYPHMVLQWIARSKKYSQYEGYCDFDDLKKIRAKNKKGKADVKS